MPKVIRSDEPGAWHHVMNRGLARRAVFEDRACMRFFKSRLAYATRRAELEIHAFAILTTHFHLLVRSPTGQIAEGMRRVQNEYVRWFNRRNRRDGPLFRGRFVSRRASSLRYRRILVGYIDRNPVSAGMAVSAEAYEYGSARHYANQDGPRWLTRDWIERDCVERNSADHLGEDTFTWAAYQSAYSTQRARAHDLAEQRLQHPPSAVDPLDELVQAAPRAVLAWMRRKAALADGSEPGLPCVAATWISAACHTLGERSVWTTRTGRRNEVDLWSVLQVGLLRDLASLRWREIAQRIEASTASAKRHYAIHQREIAGDECYANQAQETACELLRGVR